MDKNESLEVAQKRKDLMEIKLMRGMGKPKEEIRKFIEGARVRASLARSKDRELINARKMHKVLKPKNRRK